MSFESEFALATQDQVDTLFEQTSRFTLRQRAANHALGELASVTLLEHWEMPEPVLTRLPEQANYVLVHSPPEVPLAQLKFQAWGETVLHAVIYEFPFQDEGVSLERYTATFTLSANNLTKKDRLELLERQRAALAIEKEIGLLDVGSDEADKLIDFMHRING